MKLIRLQKALADAGVASRRKAEELITAGKVQVNGLTVKKLGSTVDPDNDRITVNGKAVSAAAPKVYFAVHKPIGYVSTTTATQGMSVLKLVNAPQRVFPVGRLDKDSSGLLLLTNDGDFALRVTHASFGCEKEYFVVLDRDLNPEDVRRLERGFRVGTERMPGIRITAVHPKSLRCVLRTGLNRQIRRMLGKLGYTVIKLKRIRIGRLELGDLAEGKARTILPTDVIDANV